MHLVHQFISEELVHAIGWTVIHSLWQAILIALLMGFLMIGLQKRSARIRYEIAGFSLLLVLLSALITFTLMYDKATTAIDEGMATTASGKQMITAEISATSPGFLQDCIIYFDTHMPLIVTLWLLGAAFFLLRLLGGFAYVQHIKYNRNQQLPAYWQRKLKALKQRIPIRKPVALMESALVKVPMVIGSLKPVILLPLGAVNGLSDKEVEAILAHELAHICRNDYLINLFLSTIEVLFYYHPAVWWIAANIRIERENCCDDIAVSLCGNSLTYAKTLVKLQTNSSAVPSFAMTFSGRKHLLLNRVKRILNQPQNRSNIMEKLMATSLLFLAVLFLSFSSGNPAEPQKDMEKLTSSDAVANEQIVRITKIFTDTLPPANKKSNRKKLVLVRDGQRVELSTENDEIVKLEVDGEVIPKEQYEDYTDLIEEARNVPPPPPPPPAPAAPLFRTVPEPPTPPSPPSPPTGLHRVQKQKRVTSKTDENGETTIIIESGSDDEPMEIVVDGDREYIFIDGTKIENGDTAIFIEKRDGPEYKVRMFTPDGNQHMPFHYSMPDGKIFFLDSENGYTVDQDALDEWVENFKVDVDNFMDENGEFNWEEFSEKSGLTEDQLRNRMKKHNEKLQKFQEKLEKDQMKWHKDIERQVERSEKEIRRQAERSVRVYGDSDALRYRFHGNSTQELLETQLLKDRLISSRDDYNLELSNKKLKVNGKKQSDEMHEKYLRLYRKSTGTDEDSKFSIQINK